VPLTQPTASPVSSPSPSFTERSLEKLDHFLSKLEPGKQLTSFLKKLETLASHNDKHDFAGIVADAGAQSVRAFLKNEDKRTDEPELKLILIYPPTTNYPSGSMNIPSYVRVIALGFRQVCVCKVF